MISPMMLLLTSSVIAICEAAAAQTKGRTDVYRPTKSLAFLAAERLLESDPVALTQEPRMPNLEHVVRPIRDAQSESMRNLVASLRRMLDVLHSSVQYVQPAQYRQVIKHELKSTQEDPQAAVIRYLLGHDLLLCRVDVLGLCKEGSSTIEKFRREMDLHLTHFREWMWCPVPEGEEGEFVRRFRDLHMLSARIIRRLARQGKEMDYLLTRYLWTKDHLETIGAFIGEPAFANWRTNVPNVLPDVSKIKNALPWKERAVWTDFISDLEKLLQDKQKHVQRMDRERAIAELKKTKHHGASYQLELLSLLWDSVERQESDMRLRDLSSSKDKVHSCCKSSRSRKKSNSGCIIC